MFESIDEAPKTPKAGAWAKMNFIQRSGVIGTVVLMVPTFVCDGELGVRFGQLSWSCLLIGYVAGNLWKYRHALHFWWSIGFACLVHVALLPTFARLVSAMKDTPGQGGKLYIYLAAGLVTAEVFIFLFILKRTAMWIHHHTHKAHQALGSELEPHGR